MVIAHFLIGLVASTKYEDTFKTRKSIIIKKHSRNEYIELLNDFAIEYEEKHCLNSLIICI